MAWFGKGRRGARDAAAEARVGALLDAASDALEDGRAEEALARTEEALAAAPRAVDALRLRAGILAELGRLPEAREAYDRALEEHGGDVPLLAEAAAFLVSGLPEDDQDHADLERGLALARRGLKRARKERDGARTAELLLAAGQALTALGAAGEALPLLAEAAEAAPDWVEPRLERGVALHELCRFEEAERALLEAERLDPEDALVQHHLGLVAERRGDAARALERFERARRLDREAFPKPVTLSPPEFDRAVERALAALPERVRAALANVSVSVEDLPTDHDLLASDPPLSPSILGLFRGPSMAEGGSSGTGALPAIVLYQRNLQRFARDRAELVEEIRVTLVHEVGHYLGLDEDELYERGLD
jgi:predicted Zn-dependent protease with MMP-like domain/Tfp pilus assembly protein PilF